MERRFIFALLLALCLSAQAQAQGRRFVFEKLKGIPYKPFVNSLATDEYGRLWFSTKGLGGFCYDGYHFFQYRTDSDNPASLHNDRVFALLPDHKQRVWFGTLVGLSYLDRRTNQVHRLGDNQDTVSQFHAIFEDRSGVIWVGSDGPIFRYDEAGNGLVAVAGSAKRKRVQVFYEDAENTLWAGCAGGLFRFSDDRCCYVQLDLDFREAGIKNLSVKSILEDSRGIFWIGAQEGLFTLDRSTNKLTRVALPDSLAYHSVSAVLEQNDGSLWLGYSRNGLLHWDMQGGGFQRFVHNKLDPFSLPSDLVGALHLDRFGNLWIGTTADVVRLDLEQQALSLWPINTDDPLAPINYTFRVAEDRVGGLVVGTALAIWYFKKLGAPPVAVKIDGKPNPAADFNPDANGQIWSVIQGKLYTWDEHSLQFMRKLTPPIPGGLLNVEPDKEDQNILWLGTGRGLGRLDLRSGELRHFSHFSPAHFEQFVRNMVDDGKGNLWMDIPNFLCKFDKKTGKSRIFNSDSLPPFKLVNKEVMDINLAPDGWVWVSTSGGITKIDPQSGHFYNITARQGLPENIVTTVLFESNGRIWAVSPNYLSAIDRDGNVLQNLLTNNLLQTSTWSRARAQLRDGRLLFGTWSGLALFDPARLDATRPVSRILLTKFEIAQEKNARALDVDYSKIIQLSNNENNLTLEWVGIQTACPDALLYECKLEWQGETKNWEQKGAVRQAVFAGLAPGAYVFSIRIAGRAQPQLSIHFVIAPAWWQAIWFKLLVLALAFTIAYLFWRSRENQRDLLQQKELAEQNARYKTRFLANMSHEIRTPMNAILGLSRLLTESHLPPRQMEYAEAIRQSTENLLVIVNDVLDQAKIESGKFKFQSKAFDLTLIVSHLQHTLGYKAAEKGLDFSVQPAPGTPVHLEGDPVRLIQILNNLLGNALKFTEKGRVALHISLAATPLGKQPAADTAWLLFAVNDTGIGIREDQLEQVFDSFQQADEVAAANFGGTGLGLSITKDLVEQQGGVIQLESRPGLGTTVLVWLPFKQDLRREVDNNVAALQSFALENLQILLVEDTFFNQMLAVEVLTSKIPGVDISVAENGRVALEKFEQNPRFDCVLMDVKMPVMDGLEATRRLRAMPQARLLPIVAITANAVPEELEKCRHAGMDAWVTKPIDTDELLRTLHKVLRARSVHETSSG